MIESVFAKSASETSCAFTVCSWNYLHYALTLSESFIQFHTKIMFYVFIADKDANVEFNPPANVMIVILNEDIVPELYRMAACYTILEFNTSVKAHCFDYLFDKKNYHNVVYLDPDIYILSPLDDLFYNDLLKFDCVITPHITSPVKDNLYPGDLAFMSAGIYNLGFIGFNNKPSARDFISWWKSWLIRDCSVATDRGIFVDQKFCDFVPAFISKVKIQRDPGYNLAYWNLAERELSIVNDNLYASGSIVKFIHFSGIDITKPNIFSKHQNRYDSASIGPLRGIYYNYINLLTKRNYFSSIEYGYDKLSDGTRMTQAIRECFRTYWSDIKISSSAFNVGSQFFTKSSNLTQNYRSNQVNRLVAEIFKARKDLQNTFDLTQDNGRVHLNNWAIASIKREYDIGSEYAVCESSVSLDVKSLLIKTNTNDLPLRRFTRLLKVYIFCIKSLLPFQRVLENELDDIAWSIAYSYEYIPFKVRSKLLNWVQFNHNPERKKLFMHWLSERGISEIVDNYTPDNKLRNEVVARLELGISIYGFFNTETGIGQAARDIANAIGTTNTKYSCHSVNPIGFENSVEFGSNQGMNNSLSSSLLVLNADNVLNLKSYFDPQIIEEKHKIGFFFWELPVFPGIWKKSCDYLDEIWVPSNFVMQSLKTTTTKPIKLIPLPVQPNNRDKNKSRRALNLPTEKVIFLIIFDYNSFPERKNPLAALRAFMDAFPNNKKEDPILIIKSHGSLNRGVYEKKLCQLASKHRNIIISDGVVKREEILMLQSACDIFVSLHRSEGFGLNLAECMAAKKLTIATNFSGNTDFMNDKNSILIDYKLRQLNDGDYIHWAGQSWADPDHDCAVEAFKLAAHSDSLRLTIGNLAQQDIIKMLSYDIIGHAIQNTLQDS